MFDLSEGFFWLALLLWVYGALRIIRNGALPRNHIQKLREELFGKDDKMERDRIFVEWATKYTNEIRSYGLIILGMLIMSSRG